MMQNVAADINGRHGRTMAMIELWFLRPTSKEVVKLVDSQLDGVDTPEKYLHVI